MFLSCQIEPCFVIFLLKLVRIGPLQWRALVKKLVQAGFISRHDMHKALQVIGGAHNEMPFTAGHSAMEIALALTGLGLVSREQLYALATQEVAGVVQDLLTWSAGEIHFEAGVPSPTDRFPLALRITSLLPFLPGFTPPSIISSSNPRSLREEPSLPVTPPSIPTTPHPILYSSFT